VKHFLSLAELSAEDIENLLDLAITLKRDRAEKGSNEPILANKSLGMIFEKPSLRTRVSFEMGMVHLGGHALYLSPNEVQMGKRESVADVARVLSRLVDAIMARVFDHQNIIELAQETSVPVINGLSDYVHPCQALGDMLTILEKKRRLTGLKLAYVGDGNNVANSLLFAATKLGMDFAIATPAGYGLQDFIVTLGQDFAKSSGSRIELTDDPDVAVREADIIYTDVWASMGQEEERAERLAVFPPYQVNQKLVA
jgi:ornithine carbamoyltransferase